MYRVVLYQPEIPPNTGNIIRLCANTGCELDLIGPLGFSLEQRQLRRAGLDYHELTRVRAHRDWESWRALHPGLRLWAYSTGGQRRFDEVRPAAGDGLLFGSETRGLPDWLKEELGAGQLLRIPMCAGNRSLNLSNAVAIAVYEGWRQWGYPGAG